MVWQQMSGGKGTYLQNKRVFHIEAMILSRAPIVSNLRLMFNYGAVRDRQMPLFARFSVHNSPLMGAAAIARDERPL